MADDHGKVQIFVRSLEDATTYPRNLLRTQKFDHTLKAYNSRLLREKAEVFHGSRRSIFIWDLPRDKTAFETAMKVTSPDHLKTLMNASLEDPRCRFIFFQTASSRGPLCCSHEEAASILTHHQVMPSFLDFCFEFRQRAASPISTTMYRQEDHLTRREESFGIPSLRRSGLRIQHCFNILGVEDETTPDGYPWPSRHTTVYHAFDIKEGNSLWLIVKGNKVIRERIINSIGASQNRDPGLATSTEENFLLALKNHVLLLEWCTENWSQYIDWLETKSRKSSSAVKAYPVAEMAQNIPETRTVARSLTLDTRTRSRRGTDISQGPPISPGSPGIGAFRRAFSNMSNLSRISAALSTRTQPEPAFLSNALVAGNQGSEAVNMSKVNLEDIFTFDQLQDLHHLVGKAHTSDMMLDQNRKILRELIQRYRALTASESFKEYMNMSLVGKEVSEFLQQLKRFDTDLEGHQWRIRTLIRSLERDEALFNSILQYQNMKTGEFFASLGQKSAVTMEDWTVKMHSIAARTEQETVAMGIITFFTLVFLPGTFVAVRYGIPWVHDDLIPSALTACQTLFSSGIVGFDDSQDEELGHWALRMPALKLFLVMALPLMLITLVAWAISRYIAGRRQKTDLDQLLTKEKTEGMA